MRNKVAILLLGVTAIVFAVDPLACVDGCGDAHDPAGVVTSCAATGSCALCLGGVAGGPAGMTGSPTVVQAIFSADQPHHPLLGFLQAIEHPPRV